MTLTIGSTPITMKDGTCDRMVVDCVFDKHEGFLVREISWWDCGNADHTKVIGRYGFSGAGKEQAQTAYRRAVRYRNKKHGEA